MKRREKQKNQSARMFPDAQLEPAARAVIRQVGRVLGWCVIVASPLVVLVGLVVPQEHQGPPGP